MARRDVAQQENAAKSKNFPRSGLITNEMNIAKKKQSKKEKTEQKINKQINGILLPESGSNNNNQSESCFDN